MNANSNQSASSEELISSQALIKRDADSVAGTIYRYTDIAFQRGDGVYLYDFEGHRYLDFVSGIATMNVGHCHPQVVDAIRDQAQTLIHGASHVGYLEPYVDLVEALKATAPGDLQSGKAILVNSGSEAVETAIKLARFVTNRPMILAFTDSFHGRSMGALSMTASSTLFRQRLSSLLPGVHHTPYPYCFRCPLKYASPEECDLACVNLVEKALTSVVPPDDLAGIIVEPIAGEGGYIVPPEGFLFALREICDRTGALLIADEVQTGLGRTGKMFAVEHRGIEPDIICLAKALGGGLPLGAVQKRFMAAQKEFPMIGDIRGKGLMIGVELVNPDGSPADEIIKAIIKEMGSKGIVLTKCGASAIRIAPPLIISKEQAAEGVDIILSVIGNHQWE
jgi:4-aminobutyrate aminotransferase